MRQLALVSFKGFLRDRVFQGIMAISCLFLLIPAISNISMRQITELSISLSLSLVSFVLLLLSVFLGGTTLWRDIERRYSFSVLGLPLSRSSYLLGRFIGITMCILLATLVLGIGTLAAVKYLAVTYPPDRPVLWLNICTALMFDALKYILLVALAFLFSSISTSFFLPVFGTISFFWLGTVSQQVYDYLHSPLSDSLSPLVRKTGTMLYYLIPNFTVFDLTSHAAYAIPIPFKGIIMPCGYFILVLTILLSLASLIFSKREFQ